MVLYWMTGHWPWLITDIPILGKMIRLPYWAWTIVAHMLIYNTLLYIIIARYRLNKTDELAAIRIRWSRWLSGFLFAFILAYLSYYILVQFDFFNPHWDYMISIVMSISIYGIGYMAFTQPRIFNGIFLHQVFVPKKYKTSPLSSDLANEIFENIEEYFKSDQPFLNPEIRQAHVCDALELSTHHTSQVINQKTGGSFNAYVKNYRLDYAEALIQADPSMDIKSVCFQSGFNNKTTFNTAFRHRFNCTPSDYKAKVQGKAK